MAFDVNKFLANFDSHGGFARTSKFEAKITLPEQLAKIGSMESLSLQCETTELPGYAINTVEQKIFGAPTYIAATPSFGDISLTFICAGDLWEKKLFDAWMELIVPKKTYLANYKNNYATEIQIDQYSDYVGLDNEPAPDGTSLKKLAELGLKSELKDQLIGLASRKLGNGFPGNEVRNFINKKYDQSRIVNNVQVQGLAPKIYSVSLKQAFPVTVNAMTLNWASDDIHRLTVTFKYDRWVDVTDPDPINLPPTTRDGTVKTQNLTFGDRLKSSLIRSALGKIQDKLD